jgi:hypothetical protein
MHEPNIPFPPGVPRVPIDALRPHPRNARTHSEAQLAKLVASIRAYGWTNPVLVVGDTIVAGHGRVEAAKRLGLDAVPAIRLDHLSPEQRRAYLIADNRLAEDAGWDRALLAEEFEALGAVGFDLALTGFDAAEIDAIVAQAAGIVADLDGGADADAAHGALPQRRSRPKTAHRNCNPRPGPSHRETSQQALHFRAAALGSGPVGLPPATATVTLRRLALQEVRGPLALAPHRQSLEPHLHAPKRVGQRSTTGSAATAASAA